MECFVVSVSPCWWDSSMELRRETEWEYPFELWTYIEPAKDSLNALVVEYGWMYNPLLNIRLAYFRRNTWSHYWPSGATMNGRRTKMTWWKRRMIGDQSYLSSIRMTQRACRIKTLTTGPGWTNDVRLQCQRIVPVKTRCALIKWDQWIIFPNISFAWWTNLGTRCGEKIKTIFV